MFRYVWRDLVRNLRRTVAALAGIMLGIGLFSGVLFFNAGSAASLTRRAIAPLTLDMQRVLTSPLGRPLRFLEQINAPAPLAAGQDVQLTLTVENRGSTPVHEVVINDEPPAPLAYLQATTILDGKLIADVVGQSPLAQGLARTGLNIGTLAPGATATISYRARSGRAVADPTALHPQGTVSTREIVVPVAANAPEPIELDRLSAEIGRLPAVAAADGLYFVDLPPGSLRAGTSTIAKPMRVFAFDPSYALHHPTVKLVTGAFPNAAAATVDATGNPADRTVDDTPDNSQGDVAVGPPSGAAKVGEAVLSAEAARALTATPGEDVTLTLGGRPEPVRLSVSGVADLAAAAPLFASRKSTKLEDFLYVPNSIILSPAMFEKVVIPAFQTASTTPGTLVKSLPVLEVDVMIERSRLRASPATSLEQTQAVARSILEIAPGQDYLIDNISNALEVAGNDAATGRRMFVFLGLPGAMLAAFLASYAAAILAATQRRDQANLRLRGAQRKHLTRILIHRTAIFAVVGTVVGTALGLISVLILVGPDTLFAASTTDLAVSAAIPLAVGAAVTGLALYVPGRRSLRRDVSAERRELVIEPTPVWRRGRSALVALMVAALAEVVAFRLGAFDAASTSVSLGQSPALPAGLLVAPLVAWAGGTLLAVRCSEALASQSRGRITSGFGPLIRGTLRRSLRHRARPLATGIAGGCLVTAFGMSVVIFAATYNAAKATDARFFVGGDLRLTPSVVDEPPHPPSFASTLHVPGVATVSPVVFRLENAVLIGPHDQDRANLAAIDPATFGDVAPLSDAAMVHGRASAAMSTLGADPTGVLVDADKASSLGIETGDQVNVLLARGTTAQTLQEFRVVGQFVRFPGFPAGVDIVIDIGRYERATGLHETDFFLARTTGPGAAGLSRAIAALRSGPAADQAVRIESTTEALNKDQSSLAAFDLRGLVHLDVLFTLLMSVVAVTMFVFGMILHRRREFVVLRAHGMSRNELRALLFGEAGWMAGVGSVAGALVGWGMARLFVFVLRPLFVVDPHVTLPVGQIALFIATPMTVAAAASLYAAALLGRSEASELLRET